MAISSSPHLTISSSPLPRCRLSLCCAPYKIISPHYNQKKIHMCSTSHTQNRNRNKNRSRSRSSESDLRGKWECRTDKQTGSGTSEIYAFPWYTLALYMSSFGSLRIACWSSGYRPVLTPSSVLRPGFAGRAALTLKPRDDSGAMVGRATLLRLLARIEGCVARRR